MTSCPHSAAPHRSNDCQRAHPFGTGTRLAETASGQQQPDAPVTGRRQLGITRSAILPLFAASRAASRDMQQRCPPPRSILWRPGDLDIAIRIRAILCLSLPAPRHLARHLTGRRARSRNICHHRALKEFILIHAIDGAPQRLQLQPVRRFLQSRRRQS